MDFEDFPGLSGILEDAGVVFAYVFGSRARGDHRSDSDLDVAVYSKEDMSLKDKARLSRSISKATGIETDVSALRSMSLEFRHQVLRDGDIIYCQDKEARVRFEEGVYRRYLDIKPLMKQFNDSRREAW